MSGDLCVLINGGILGMLGQGLRLAYIHYRWVMVRKDENYFWTKCNPISCLVLSFLAGYGAMYILKEYQDVTYTLAIVLLSGYFSPIPLLLILLLLKRKRNKTNVKFS